MDLGFNETQQMLKNSAREFLSQECPHSLVREMEQDPKGYPDQLWKAIIDLGWTGIAFPQKYGGTEGSFVDLAVLVEEMGRALAPSPFFSTVVMAGMTILEAGSEAQKDEFLTKICQGQETFAFAVTEPSATYEAWGIETEAAQDGDGFTLNGTKLFVPDAHTADNIVVAARTTKGSNPEDGITLFIVPASAQGISIEMLSTVASDRQAEVGLSNVKVPAGAVLGEVDKGWPTLNRAIQRGAAAKSVEMLGGAGAVLDMTLEYVKQRVQFGRPIGSFQAVQHHCANMVTFAESCRYMAYQAVWTLDEGLPATQEVSMAKTWVNEAYRKVCALAHQCHGAIGFTMEHDLQLFSRRARVAELAFGDAEHHRELVAESLGI